MKPDAIILSGGPASLSAEESPRPAEEIWEQGVPVLGICYGMQSMVEKCGGKVLPHDKRGIRSPRNSSLGRQPAVQWFECDSERLDESRRSGF